MSTALAIGALAVFVRATCWLNERYKWTLVFLAWLVTCLALATVGILKVSAS